MLLSKIHSITDGQKIKVEVLFWAVLPDVRLHCFQNSQASPSGIYGNSKMKIARGIGGMILTGKTAPVPLRPPHTAHELARDSNLGPLGKRHATNGLNQGTVAGRTDARVPWGTRSYCREKKKYSRLGFPHGTGFTVFFQRLCIGFSPYRSNSASPPLPLPREMVEFDFPGTLCRILETERRPGGFLCIYRFLQQRAFSGAEGGSDTACLVQSKFNFLCLIDLVRVHCYETFKCNRGNIFSVILVIELENAPGNCCITACGCTYVYCEWPNVMVQSAVLLCIPEVLGSNLGLQTHFLWLRLLMTEYVPAWNLGAPEIIPSWQIFYGFSRQMPVRFP